MTISFSGLASGLDTSSWVEALVSVKKEEVKGFETKLKEMQTIKTKRHKKCIFNTKKCNRKAH